MPYAKKKLTRTTWISVPIDTKLHTKARTKAIPLRLAWPEIIDEAVSLWCAKREPT